MRDRLTAALLLALNLVAFLIAMPLVGLLLILMPRRGRWA